jgi:hypothetical protein
VRLVRTQKGRIANMRQLKMSKVRCVTTAAIGLGMAYSAPGATITYTSTTGATYPATVTTSSSTNSSLTLPDFDATLGTLTGVTLSGTIKATTDGSLATNATFSNPVPYSGLTIKFATDLTSSTADAFSLTANGTSTFSGTAYGPGNYYGSNVSLPVSGDVLAANLSDYIGSGTFNEILSGSGLLTNNGGSTNPTFVTGTGAAQLGDSVSVVYTYTPAAVPEPASLSLLGFGALGLLRRRARRVVGI